MSDTSALINSCQLYLPIEHQAALAHGIELPGQAHGAALFADISGFTPLTEALTRALGLRRGAEELPIYLDRVYDDLIAEVHRYCGSVVGFAGDAITCWFDDEPAGVGKNRPGVDRACQCAQALQAAMQTVANIQIPGQADVALSVKVAVACGKIQRFVVGDPSIQRIELIAGQTVLHMAAAEHQASKGEIILDPAAADALKDQISIREWREADEQRFAVLKSLDIPTSPHTWQKTRKLTLNQAKPWVLPAVYNRLASGMGDFLTELRPVVALFLRFGGIDYDGDPFAGQKLDAYIRWVQGILNEQEAILTHPTIGDKGSFLCIAFGAPIAHEDDPRRAAATALKLSQPPPELNFINSIQIGLSQGMARTGSYGGSQRRTYDVLGDQVNLAARLMVNATPGSILVSERLRDSLSSDFSLQELPAIMVKGKSLPVAVFQLTGTRLRGEGGLDEFMQPARQLINRKSELERLQTMLADIITGHGVFCQLTGPAGIGKSLLAGSAMSLARERGIQLLAAACSSNSNLAPYSVWQPIFRNLLGLNSGKAKPEEYLEKVIIEQNPHWLIRLPLLGNLVGVDLPDNRTTAAMDAGSRHEATLTLAVEMIQSQALDHPVMIVLEDCQWLDEASGELLLALGRVMREMPIFLLATRRTGADWLSGMNELEVSQVLELAPLNGDAIGELIAGQLDRGKKLDSLAIAVIQSQAQGNPSFAGQLAGLMVESGSLVEKEAHIGLSEAVINALRDCDCIEKDLDSGEWQVKKGVHIPTSAIGVPDNVQAIMLARVDRLAEQSKITLKVASVIGRTFAREILQSAHPTAARKLDLTGELQELQDRGFLEQGSHAGEYAFILNALHEVIYNALPTAQQENLHVAVGQALERHNPGDITGLAYHFTRAGGSQRPKALSYLDQAARAAQRSYANHTALNYYHQAIGLEMRWEWLSGQVEVLHLLGVRDEERDSIETLEKLPTVPPAVVYKLQYELNQAVGAYAVALAAGERLLAESRATGNWIGEAESLRQLGLVKRKLGDNQAALTTYNQAKSVLDKQTILDPAARRVKAQLLNNLGYLLSYLGQSEESHQLLTMAAHEAGSIEDSYLEANILQDLGLNSLSIQDLHAARSYFERVMEITKAIGCRNWEALAHLNLAIVDRMKGNYSNALNTLHVAIKLLRATGDQWNEIRVLNELGAIQQELGQYGNARVTFTKAQNLCFKIDKKNVMVYTIINLGLVERAEHQLDQAARILNEGLSLADELGDAFIAAAYRSQLGLLAIETGDIKLAGQQAKAALNARKKIRSETMVSDNLAVLAHVHLRSGDRQKALSYASQTIQLIHDTQGVGPENPLQDAHLVFQVFEQLQCDDKAREALQLAYDLVWQRANHIQEPELRESFLTNVPVNAAIIKDASRLGLTEGTHSPVKEQT